MHAGLLPSSHNPINQCFTDFSYCLSRALLQKFPLAFLCQYVSSVSSILGEFNDKAACGGNAAYMQKTGKEWRVLMIVQEDMLKIDKKKGLHWFGGPGRFLVDGGMNTAA